MHPPNAEAQLQAAGSICGPPARVRSHLARRSTATPPLLLALDRWSDSLGGNLSRRRPATGRPCRASAKRLHRTEVTAGDLNPAHEFRRPFRSRESNPLRRPSQRDRCRGHPKDTSVQRLCPPNAQAQLRATYQLGRGCLHTEPERRLPAIPHPSRPSAAATRSTVGSALLARKPLARGVS
jgi:hypothetical protein